MYSNFRFEADADAIAAGSVIEGKHRACPKRFLVQKRGDSAILVSPHVRD
jgi:hypothetical protein